MNNLIALRAGEKLTFGNSEETNKKLEPMFNHNGIKYSEHDNADSQFNIFFGYESEKTGRTFYPDLSIIYDSDDVREMFEMKLIEMTKNQNIYNIYK